MKLPELNKWQIKDGNIVMPYYTHPSLEWLSRNILSKFTVLEIGAGYSTYWWRAICDVVVSLEPDKELADQLGCININSKDIGNVLTHGNTHYDVVIVDTDEDRETYVLEAFAKCKKIFIIDNWQQPEVSVYSDEVVNYLYSNSKKQLIFKQPSHDTWQTAIFVK